MSEIALTAEHVVVVGRGRLIADAQVAEIVAQASPNTAVRVRTPEAARAARRARRPRRDVTAPSASSWRCTA